MLVDAVLFLLGVMIGYVVGTWTYWRFIRGWFKKWGWL